MAKKSYTPAEQRAISMNPNNKAFWMHKGFNKKPADADERVASGKGALRPPAPIRKDMIGNPNNKNFKPKK